MERIPKDQAIIIPLQVMIANNVDYLHIEFSLAAGRVQSSVLRICTTVSARRPGRRTIKFDFFLSLFLTVIYELAPMFENSNKPDRQWRI